ncbi:MAG TPA: sulfotransferase [Gammaproteobacteria bacterium]
MTAEAVAQPTLLDQALADFDAGKYAEAALSSAQLLAEQPHDPRVLHLAGAMALQEQRFLESENLLGRALRAAQTPHDQAMIWSTTGRLARTVGNLDHSEESYRRATLLDPATVDHVIAFALLLASRGKLDPAIEVMRGAIVRHPRDPYPCVTLGNLLLQAGRQRDALAFYDMALQRNPNYAPAHFNAGVALTMLGKVDAALTATQNALKIEPGMAGYYQLASLDGLKLDDPVIPQLETLADLEGAALDERIDANFALGRVYDSAGDAARAFPRFARGNALKRATLDYDIRNDEERTERVIALFSRDFFERFRGISDSKLAPIFIVGMPRSGTTLTEQMLAGHSKVEAGGELTIMPGLARRLGETWGSRGEASPGTDAQVKADILEAAAAYIRETAKLQSRRPHFTDKLPGNFLFIGLIHLMFPEARIIHCRRDPVDTCLSCFQRLFSSDVLYSYDLRELGRHYRLYQRLMDHWHAVLPPGRILDVGYESVVADPETNLRRVLSFCGLEFEPGCLEFHEVKRSVTTASAAQVRKPLYKTSVNRHQKYGADLAPLLEALELHS